MGQTDLAVIFPYSLPTISYQNQPNIKKNLLKSEDFERFFGISTACGYNAPCFEGMVHYYIGSVLMLLDNEDEKDKVAFVNGKWNQVSVLLELVVCTGFL